MNNMECKSAPEFNVVKLQADTHDKLGSIVRLINPKELIDNEVWIELGVNIEVVRFGLLYDILDLSGPEAKLLDSSLYSRENIKWVKLALDETLVAEGYHLLKLNFMDRHSDFKYSYYVSYIIQNDNPDKPYIYMNREVQ